MAAAAPPASSRPISSSAVRTTTPPPGVRPGTGTPPSGGPSTPSGTAGSATPNRPVSPSAGRRAPPPVAETATPPGTMQDRGILLPPPRRRNPSGHGVLHPRESRRRPTGEPSSRPRGPCPDSPSVPPAFARITRSVRTPVEGPGLGPHGLVEAVPGHRELPVASPCLFVRADPLALLLGCPAAQHDR